MLASLFSHSVEHLIPFNRSYGKGTHVRPAADWPSAASGPVLKEDGPTKSSTGDETIVAHGDSLPTSRIAAITNGGKEMDSLPKRTGQRERCIPSGSRLIDSMLMYPYPLSALT